MNIRTTLITTGLIAASLVSGAAQAALQGRDLNGSVSSAEAYYDTVLDITWLADAKYAITSGYDADGLMDWWAANTWAANLSVNGYDNWRLPTVEPVDGSNFNYIYDMHGNTDVGFNVSEQGTPYAGSTGSEMAHLFYNTLNNKGYCSVSTSCANGSQAGSGLLNTGPFTNFSDFQGRPFWSGSEFAPVIGDAWYFGFTDGSQGAFGKYNYGYALAVSNGDVGIAVVAVPEAQTYAMMLAGLGLVGFMAKRSKQVEA